jgi:hypothetical protein
MLPLHTNVTRIPTLKWLTRHKLLYYETENTAKVIPFFVSIRDSYLPTCRYTEDISTNYLKPLKTESNRN